MKPVVSHSSKLVFLYAVLFSSVHSATQQNSVLKNWKHFAGLNELIQHTLARRRERELQMEALSRVISIQAYNKKPEPGSLVCPPEPSKTVPLL